MVANRMRGFIRRHPRVRQAARRLRRRLPRRLGGIGQKPLPSPPSRGFELALPRPADAPGTEPAALSVRAHRGLWVPRKLEKTGLAGFEPETLACFLAALEHARPGAVLDVGANVGLYGLLAAARCRRAVYAFEPTPHVAAAARDLAAHNGLPVDVVELAMNDRSGSATLTVSSMSDASNSLASGFRPEAARLSVRTDTLSRWCEHTGTSPAVIKIDTESTEPDVVAGGREVLRESRPWVFCEVLPGRGAEERLMELLGPLGYTWHQMNGDMPAPARTAIDAQGAAPHQRMWLFAPSPPTDALWERARVWHRALEDCTPAGSLAESGTR